METFVRILRFAQCASLQEVDVGQSGVHRIHMLRNTVTSDFFPDDANLRRALSKRLATWFTCLLLQLPVVVHLHVGVASEGPGVTVGENGGVSEVTFGGTGPQQLRILHLHATRRPLVVLDALGLVCHIPFLEAAVCLPPCRVLA